MKEKKYNISEDKDSMAAEPFADYGGQNVYSVAVQNASTREQIMKNTVSVDEYFDELIRQVHKDYENI